MHAVRRHFACVASKFVDGNCRQNCRQRICGCRSRLRPATRLFSIKQIEISRVSFENHLPWQMDTILIQKGNSSNRDCRSGHDQGALRPNKRALKPGCGYSMPTKRRRQKSSLTYFSLIGLRSNCRTGCPTKVSNRSITARLLESQGVYADSSRRGFFELFCR